MTSNIFSRFNSSSGRGGRSFYEDLRSGEAGGDDTLGADGYDVEERAGLALDEENLNQQFHDYDLENANDLGLDASRATVESAAPATIAGGAAASAAAAAAAGATAASSAMRMAGGAGRRGRRNVSRPQWAASGDDDGDNDDVPGSLLVEPHGNEAEPLPPLLKATPLRSNPSERRSRGPSGHIPSVPTKKNRAQWDTTQNQQRLHRDDRRGGAFGQPPGPVTGATPSPAGGAPGHALLSYFFPSSGSQTSTAHDRAMWRWVNVSNLDNFIRDVYDYYRDSGLRCIMLARLLHLL